MTVERETVEDDRAPMRHEPRKERRSQRAALIADVRIAERDRLTDRGQQTEHGHCDRRHASAACAWSALPSRPILHAI